MQTNDPSQNRVGASPSRRARLVFFAVVALIGATLASQISALATRKGDLSALVQGPGFVARGQRPVVQVTVFNGSGDTGIVAWRTPFRGVNGNIFDVRRDGQRVAYTGALYKFAA